MNIDLDPVEVAIAKRLRMLASFPVDLRGLDLRLRQAGLAPRRRVLTRVWINRFVAVAASLIIVAVIALALMVGERQAVAAPTEMAQIHRELVSGHSPVAKAASIGEANELIAAMAHGKIILPDVPAMHTMACCMRSVKNKSVACVLMEHEGTPITMAVAHARDLGVARGETLERGGQMFHVQRTGDLVMVTAVRGDRWVCLIGQLAPERLADVIAQLTF